MERELWPLLYRELRAAARGVRPKAVRYHPWVIAAVLLWAALHDRPVGWACDRRNWSATRLRPGQLPSAATVSRRARRADVAGFLDRVAERLRGDGPPGWEFVVDGKPLPVGGCSKDPDATPGPRGPGYKLHAIWGGRCLPEAWAVTGLGEYEGAVAERLLAGLSGAGVLLADGNYEASRVYDAAAAAGYQLLAPPDRRDTGRGHRYQSPHRLRCLGWFADGLGPLPAWVRRLGRVARWVWCKLVINAARILRRQRLAATLQ